jgi:hypothetical protein
MISLCVSTQSFGQTKLDIKSKILEKYQLRHFKAGLIELLKADGYEIGEFGEDFAIWITECESGEDYCIKVELCKPSMVSWTRRVIYWTKLSFSIPQSVIDQCSSAATDEEKEALVGFVISRAAAWSMPGGFIAHAFYSSLFYEIYKIIRRDPTPKEMAESIYGAAKLRDAARYLLSKVGK